MGLPVGELPIGSTAWRTSKNALAKLGALGWPRSSGWMGWHRWLRRPDATNFPFQQRNASRSQTQL
jgi:hypothetical protein